MRLRNLILRFIALLACVCIWCIVVQFVDHEFDHINIGSIFASIRDRSNHLFHAVRHGSRLRANIQGE